MVKLFVVGLPRDMSESELAEIFGEFGDVHQVKLITEKDTGMSKGYAFIDFLDEPGARLAVKEMEGCNIDERTISVRVADKQPKSQKTRPTPMHTDSTEQLSMVSRMKRPRLSRD